MQFNQRMARLARLSPIFTSGQGLGSTGSLPSFDPAKLPGLILNLDAQIASTRWQDAGATTPCIAQGDACALWKGRGALTNANGTVGHLPTLDLIAMNALPSFLFNGNTFVTDNFLSSALNTAFTFWIVSIRLGSSLQFSSANQSNSAWYSGINAFTTITYDQFNLNPALFTTIRTATGLTIVSIELFTYDGATKTFYRDGIPITQAATGNLGLSGTLTIGDFVSGGFAWTGYIGGIGVCQGVLSTKNRNALLGYLANKWKTDLPFVTYLGDSLTVGFESTNPFPNQVAALIPSSYVTNNIAVVGATLASGIATQAASVGPVYYSPLRKKNISVILGGTNDNIGGASAATMFASLQTVAASCFNAGEYVIVLTQLPCTNGSFSETVRQTFNASILSQPLGVYWNAVADIGNDPTIGAPGSQNNPTYYNADKIHLLAAGDTIVASYVAPLVAAA